MKSIKVKKFIKILSAIDALGFGFLLIVAFIMQFALNQLPCPLCLLQRIGILGISFGFLLNVQFAIHPRHYTLSLLSAMLTAAVSLRQILLHVLPGDPGYGLPFLGFHLYTWTFFICVGVMFYIAIVLSITTQYESYESVPSDKILEVLKHLAFSVVFFLAISNGVSTYFQCGFKQCPDNPVSYRFNMLPKRVPS